METVYFNSDAAHLKWACGLTWIQVGQALSALYETEVHPDRARSAARRYARDHPTILQASDIECPERLCAIANYLKATPPPPPPPTLDLPDHPEASFVVTGNEAELTYTSVPLPQGHPIQTLDELIAAHQIDLAVWVQVGEVKHNTWTTAAFDRHTATWSYFQNHQIIARFVKRHPEPLHPQIQPVQPIAILPPPDLLRRSPDGVWREVIFTDVQLGYNRRSADGLLTPFHDRRALDILLQVVEAVQPQRVHCLGDGIDAAELSDRYPRPPAVHETLQPAFCEWHWWWYQLRRIVPDADLVYHEGNHEERLQRFLIAHFPAVYELHRADQLLHPPVLSFENLIALDAVKVRWVGAYPQDEDWSAELRLVHGDTARKNPGSTAWAIAQDADTDEVFGHIHRPELVTTISGRRHRRVVQVYCPGCMCHLDGRVPGSAPDLYWSQGFVVRDFLPDGSLATETFVGIEDGRALFAGQLYAARDRCAELQAAYPGYNWGCDIAARRCT